MQNNRDAIRQAMKPIADFLEENAVPYAVVGSVAGISHGYGRATIDIDVLAELPLPNGLAAEFEARFSTDYYVDAAMIRDAVKWKGSFNLLHLESGIKIDIFVSKGSAFDQEVTRRRELETMNDEISPAFWVQSSEDLVLSKLAWYRKGGGASDRQWNDLLAVLKLQTFDIDLEYMQHWAPQLGVADLLDKALDEAGFNETEKDAN